MSAGNWLLIAVVAASTLIGTAIVLYDRWAHARAVIELTQREPGTPMPAAADGEPICEATDGIWTCTRPPGHEGDHASHGMNIGTVPVYTWPRKPQEDQ
jgi:hypothetical protein